MNLTGIFTIALSGLCVVSAASQSPEIPDAALPRVLSAPDPIYPKIALAARVSGIVRLHVVTDGKRVVSIDGENGPMMLRPSAEENVRAWIFEEHSPTSFDVTYEYKLLDVQGCAAANRGVIRDLPKHVEIDDAPPTCDWVRYKRQETYLREQHVYPVELHVDADGEALRGPSEVTIHSEGTEYVLPVRDGLFLVPETLKNTKTFTFEARIGDEFVTIPQISGWAVEQTWTLDLPSKVPADAEDTYRSGDPKTVCILSFDPLDGDGMSIKVSSCRKRIDQH